MRQFFTSCCFVCRELNLRTATTIIGIVHVIAEILELYIVAVLYNTYKETESTFLQRNQALEELLEGRGNIEAMEKLVQDHARYLAKITLAQAIIAVVLLISSILLIVGSVLGKEKFLLPFVILRMLQIIGGLLYAAYVFIAFETVYLKQIFQSFLMFALFVLTMLILAFLVAAYAYLVIVVFNYYLKLRAERLERLYVHQHVTAGVPMLHTGNLPKEGV